MTVPATRPDDAWSPWLRSVNPSTAIFCRAEVRAPWGFRIGAAEQATFHVLTHGRTILEVDGVPEALELTAGEMVLIPHGAGHELKSSSSTPVRPLEEAVTSGTSQGKVFEFGGGGTTAVMVCGGCDLGPAHGNGPVAALPAVLRYEADPGLVEVMERESRALAAGGEAVLSQTLGLLVTQALRAFLSARSEDGRPVAISAEVSRAVAFLHDHLGEPVDLHAVCSAAGLSRSSLSERFRAAMGMSPMRYLRRIRLARAAELLTTTRQGVARVARTVGYSSTSSFSRAFRDAYGASPGAYRRTAGSPSS